MTHLVITDPSGNIEGPIRAGVAPAPLIISLSDSQFDEPPEEYYFEIEFFDLMNLKSGLRQPETGFSASQLYAKGGEYEIKAKAYDRKGNVWSARRSVIVEPGVSANDPNHVAQYYIFNQVDNPQVTQPSMERVFSTFEEALAHARVSFPGAKRWIFSFFREQLHEISETVHWRETDADIALGATGMGSIPMLLFTGKKGAPFFEVVREYEEGRHLILAQVGFDAPKDCSAMAAVVSKAASNPMISIIECMVTKNMQSLVRLHPTEQGGLLRVSNCRTLNQLPVTNWIEVNNKCRMVDIMGCMFHGTEYGYGVLSGASDLRISYNVWNGTSKSENSSFPRLKIVGGSFIHIERNILSTDTGVVSPDITLGTFQDEIQHLVIERNDFSNPILLQGAIKGLAIRNNKLHSIQSDTKQADLREFKQLKIWHNTFLMHASRFASFIHLSSMCPGFECFNNLFVIKNILWDTLHDQYFPMANFVDESVWGQLRGNIWPIPFHKYKEPLFELDGRRIFDFPKQDFPRFTTFGRVMEIEAPGPETRCSQLGLPTDMHGNLRGGKETTIGAVEMEPVIRSLEDIIKIEEPILQPSNLKKSLSKILNKLRIISRE